MLLSHSFMYKQVAVSFKMFNKICEGAQPCLIGNIPILEKQTNCEHELIFLNSNEINKFIKKKPLNMGTVLTTIVGPTISFALPLFQSQNQHIQQIDQTNGIIIVLHHRLLCTCTYCVYYVT